MRVTGDGGTGSYNTHMERNKKVRRSGNNNKIRVHIRFNYAGVNAKIAAARTKSQTAAIERSLRALLENAKRCNSDAYTVRAIKKAIGKAKIKVKALGKEERMENFRKAAKGAENFREEKRIANELNSKRRTRKRKEKARIQDVQSEYEKQNSYKGSEMDIICSGVELSEAAQAEVLQSVDMTV